MEQQYGGMERMRTSAPRHDREARAHRLGWSMAMVAAAGLCWAEVSRAENVAVELRATIVQLDVATGDRAGSLDFQRNVSRSGDPGERKRRR